MALLMGYKHWLVLIVFLGVWRLIQDYVSSPRIMGHSMELHPLAAIFGVMAGGEVAGILGYFSFHSGDGEFANRIPALAAVCGETKVRPAE